MSDNTLRPIWTPEDARQTARDAAKHRAEPRVLADPDDTQPDVFAELDLLDEDQDDGLDCSLGDGRHRTGKHRAPTVAGMRPRRALRLARTAIGVGVVVFVLALGALWASSQSKADPYPSGAKCVDQFWLIPFQSNRRTICDGPILPDGSWIRLREFYSPAHRVPLRTSCYGTYSFSCTTTGGYTAERTSNGIESYSVRPETVLADEPGHIA